MGPVALAAALVLSLAPPVLAWIPGASAALESTSFLSLALLPWIALGGLPRGPRAEFVPARGVPGIALPALALAGALDARAGADPLALLVFAAWGMLFVALLASAAARAAAHGERGSLYGPLWLALVPGSASLALALRHADGGRPAFATWLGRASPLGWCVARAEALAEGQRITGAEELLPQAPLGALLACGLLWIASRPRRAALRSDPTP